MKITLLNHASVLMDFGSFRLLTDPWLQGSCFHKGWELLHPNPKALDQATKATHLWISHFHSDHLHMPTLKELVKRNPRIMILANDSANFKISQPLKKLGFQNIISFDERTKIQVAHNIFVTRFGVTGIDNALLLESDEGVFLNYNDCNLPLKALKQIVRKIPNVDVLLTNFNHARKLMEFPPLQAEEVKKQLHERFEKIIRTINPKAIIPFASFHYYTAPEAVNQNASLLTLEELEAKHEKIAPLHVGQTLEWDQKESSANILPLPAQEKNALNRWQYDSPCSIKELLEKAQTFVNKMKKEYFYITFGVKPLRIFVTDHQAILILDTAGCSIEACSSEKNADIQTHSESLQLWFDKPYGTDSFFVGARFDILHPDPNPIHNWLLYLLLMENSLSPLSALKLLTRVEGWKFFWNRREEILAVLLGWKFHAGSRN